MQAEQTTVESLRSFLEGFGTLGGRAAATALIAAIAVTFGWILLPRIVDGAEKSGIQWAVSGAVLRAIQTALLTGAVLSLTLVWGFGFLIDDAAASLDGRVSQVGRGAASLLLAFGAYVGARVLRDTVSNLSRRTEWMTDHQEEIVLRVSQLSLFLFVGLLIVSGVWGVDLSGLLVGAGFLGIVVGFAARQTLGSLIAGFVLMFSRPFTIGDWVEVGDQEGIVTDITIFNTRLENFDGEFLIIPNDTVSNKPITNRSQKGLLRLKVDVGVDYETDPDRARTVALEAISNLVEVVDAPPPQVFPKAFGDSAIVLEMRFWIDHPTPPRKWKAISAVISAVKSAFAEEGIKIPYPQRELSGRAETGGFRVQHDGEPARGTAESAESPEATAEHGGTD